MRAYILQQDKNITKAWKYKYPFFTKAKCFAIGGWIKNTESLYRYCRRKGINHPDLNMEKRTRKKILLIDPATNIPIKKLDNIFKEIPALYK